MSFFRPRFAHKTVTKSQAEVSGPDMTGFFSEPLMAEDGTLMLSGNGDLLMGLVTYVNPLNLGGTSDSPPSFGSE